MSGTTDESAGARAIRPFMIEIPEAEIEALRTRIAATRWPEKETVADQSQGVPLARIQELARYWGSDYDWRRCEAQLNALPHFITEIDGSTFISSTSNRGTKTRCHLSSTTGGLARSSSS
jgi:hypothetical protein